MHYILMFIVWLRIPNIKKVPITQFHLGKHILVFICTLKLFVKII